MIEILYWYQAGDPPRIALARSIDGRAWTKDPSPCSRPARAAVSTSAAFPTPT